MPLLPRFSLLRVSLGAALSLVLGGSLARGQAEPVVLRYRAAAGCPSEAEFVRQILARTSQARFTDSGAGARIFSVDLAPGARDFVGRLEIGDRAGALATREIRGDSCEELSAALALLVALAVDPEALSAPPAASAAPPGSAVIPAVSAAPAASSAPTSSASPASSASPVIPAPAAERPDHPWLVAAGAVGAVRRGPGVLPGGAVSVGYEPGPSAAGPWVWAGRVGIGLYGLGSAPEGQGVFRWRVASFEGCPLVWGNASITLRPCVTLEIGQIQGQGQEGAVFQPLTNARLWAAAGAEGRAQWSPLDRLSLEGVVGVVAPLRSYSFVFERPRVPVYEVPAVGGVAGLAVGYHFP